MDITTVGGTGHGGRIKAGDIRTAAETARTPVPQVQQPAKVRMPTTPPLPGALGEDKRIPIRSLRRKIAEALRHSVDTAVHYTAVDEADVTALDAKRREYASLLGRKLSILPFVMTAVCRALRMHPPLNANVDDEKGEIILRSAVNLGCAVDTDEGLMVPVVKDADQLSLVELDDSVRGLAGLCRERKIAREQMMGGTFTISNVGSYGGMFATPVINYPEVAILAVGRAKEKVMTSEGRFYAGLSLPLSLSCDHRIVDGAEATRFLGTLVGLLEQPEGLLG